MTARERDPYLCAAGSFFLPGLGQVYSGRILRGVIFLIPAVIITLPYSLISMYIYLDYSTVMWTSFLASPISRIVDFAVRVIATYDALNVAKRLETPSA